ncbi:4-amino-4-deoxychorismate lyase [Microbulbifer aggregans]|uniref:4-amino-4-deoxychorismate lyase n=1 Tax=Microbulbifer aggregans TaxID=1769779 RepID=A0A1C9WA34_9GAMM|nr:aminotransferase class IV [Microbulbifer aggregans]AOS98026.1 4-amino-4-deoxychorismate lyase [Microbulbifer aggregans]
MDLPLLVINGQASGSLPDDAQITHGLLETMRGARGSVPLWPYHRARLMRSNRVSVSVLDRIGRFLGKALGSLSHHELRLRLRVGLFDGCPYWDLRAEPLVAPAGLGKGVTLYLCETRLPCGESANAGCKELARSRYNRAMEELPFNDLLHDGLLLDDRGLLVETLRCNLLLWQDGRWVTPDLAHCGVRGVMRDWLRERVAIVETSLDLESLEAAQEVAICNSVRGVIPVRALNGSHKWAVGQQTSRLQNLVVEELW